MQYSLSLLIGRTVQFNYTMLAVSITPFDFPLLVSRQIQLHVTISFTLKY